MADEQPTGEARQDGPWYVAVLRWGFYQVRCPDDGPRLAKMFLSRPAAQAEADRLNARKRLADVGAEMLATVDPDALDGYADALVDPRYDDVAACLRSMAERQRIPVAKMEGMDATGTRVARNALPYCCKVGCTKPAEFELWEQGTMDPYGNTHACREHVGELLSYIGEPATTPDHVWWTVCQMSVGASNGEPVAITKVEGRA